MGYILALTQASVLIYSKNIKSVKVLAKYNNNMN